jgi:hypothetical protein
VYPGLPGKKNFMDDNGNCSLYLKHMNCDPRTLFVILKHRAGTEYGKFKGYILVYGATLYSAILDSPAVTVTADQYEAAPVNTVVKTSIDLDDLYNSNTRACHKSNRMSNLGKDILRYVFIISTSMNFFLLLTCEVYCSFSTLFLIFLL